MDFNQKIASKQKQNFHNYIKSILKSHSKSFNATSFGFLNLACQTNIFLSIKPYNRTDFWSFSFIL